MSDPAYRALLIGNSTFPNDPHNLQPLEGPVNDVTALKSALVDPELGLLKPTSVRAVPERTMSEILIELERFFATASRDDVLLLYYSGHGLLDEHNQLYLCARDSRADLMKATTVSARSVNAMIDGSRAQTTVILLDCCYAGSFKSGQLPDSLRGTGRYLLTSCRSGQLANDAIAENHTSAFTQHLVDGMLRGARDSDGDGFVDLSDVYDYVYDALSREGRQLPQRNFSGGGDIAIARRPGLIDSATGADGRTGAESTSSLELSPASIDLRDVASGERLPLEEVFVHHASAEWEVRSEAPWLDVDRRERSFTIDFRPQPGVNRANVVVVDRATGDTATLRIRVEVGRHRPGHPRRRIITISAAVLAVVLLVAIAVMAGDGDEGGVGDDSQAVEVGAEIDAAAGWIDTGIFLEDGATIELDASGRIRHAAGGTPVGPDGEQGSAGHGANIVADADHAALIGRFGNDGEPFFVGSSWSLTADDNGGKLWLAVNDSGLENNSGSFTVAGVVTPPQSP